MKIRFYSKTATVNRLKRIWNNEVMPELADNLMDDCNTYVRMQSGDLADSIDKEQNGKLITWSTAYAKRVYYTGTPRKNVNPNASLRWCEVAKRAHKGEWVKKANGLLKG